MRRVLSLAVAVLLMCGALLADEGMWLYNAFPKDKVKGKYGFEPTQEFLDHLRLSSVRMGASASFVSPDGLVFTNHHVGAGCIHNISTGGKDYMKNGFYARNRAEEAECPGIEVSIQHRPVRRSAWPCRAWRRIARWARASAAKS